MQYAIHANYKSENKVRPAYNMQFMLITNLSEHRVKEAQSNICSKNMEVLSCDLQTYQNIMLKKHKAIYVARIRKYQYRFPC